MEIGSWAEFWIVANLALEVSEDDESLHYSALCNVIGQLHCELGRAAEGRPYLQTAMKIRERLLPPDHEDLSDTYNNYANIINVQWENDEALDTALEYYKRAIDIDATKPKAERDQILHVRHLNFGTLYTCQERWDKAWAELIEGQKYTIQTFGPNKHWDAT
jgi:tetratricopeptide (TPR) repeat protein